MLHFVIINDASSQNFDEILDLENITLINIKKNIGNQKCINIGILYINSKKINFDYLIIMDADAEDNPLKHNKFIPGVNIPIKSKTNLDLKKAVVLVLAWNFFNEIKSKNKKLCRKFINLKSMF